MNDPTEPGASKEVDDLIAELASKDHLVRNNARRELARMGREIVPQLKELLRSPQEHVRWEGTKILGAIGGEQAMEVLATALPDPSHDVRWTAVEGLIEGREAAYQPVLHQLVVHSSNIGVREAGAHILSHAVREEHSAFLRPVLRALRGRAPVFEVSLAAYQALTLYHRAKARLDMTPMRKVGKNSVENST